ncbi:hypothetical protein RJ55_02128 [Drechmeria coniospora]|nr:hypothetical protein RJ55_02128 [Drechmeria coniospora]
MTVSSNRQSSPTSSLYLHSAVHPPPPPSLPDRYDNVTDRIQPSRIMIVDGETFACGACVRGHRTGSCQHSDRPLQLIKKKGRPVSQCDHCRSMRHCRSAHVKCVCAKRAREGADDSGGKEPCRCWQDGHCKCAFKRDVPRPDSSRSTKTPTHASPHAASALDRPLPLFPGALSPAILSPGALSPGAPSPGTHSPGTLSRGALSPGALLEPSGQLDGNIWARVADLPLQPWPQEPFLLPTSVPSPPIGLVAQTMMDGACHDQGTFISDGVDVPSSSVFDLSALASSPDPQHAPFMWMPDVGDHVLGAEQSAPHAYWVQDPAPDMSEGGWMASLTEYDQASETKAEAAGAPNCSVGASPHGPAHV